MLTFFALAWYNKINIFVWHVNWEDLTMNYDTEKWISIEESAEHLGVKVATIRDWIRKEKGIPAHKIGRQWKFKISELDNWVNSGKSAIE